MYWSFMCVVELQKYSSHTPYHPLDAAWRAAMDFGLLILAPDPIFRFWSCIQYSEVHRWIDCVSVVVNKTHTHHSKEYRLEILPHDSRAPGSLQMYSGASKLKIWVWFSQNSGSYFQFFDDSEFSSRHHSIRLRIPHRYSWADFLWDPPHSLGAASKSVTPPHDLISITLFIYFAR